MLRIKHKMSPLMIRFMLAAYCAPDPSEAIGQRQWNSQAGQACRRWMLDEGLVVHDNGRATERLNAMVHHLCNQALPVKTEKWVRPDDPE